MLKVIKGSNLRLKVDKSKVMMRQMMKKMSEDNFSKYLNSTQKEMKDIF